MSAPRMTGANPVSAASFADNYKSLSNIGSRKLLKMGDYYRDIRHRLDSAMACYSIVASRYKPDMDDKEAELCLEGYYQRWQTQFFGSCNFLHALDDLQMAEEIVNKYHLPDNKLNYSYGCVYMTFAMSTDEDQYDQKASNMLRKAFIQSYKAKDYRTMHRAFDNLVSIYRVRKNIDSISNEANILYKLKEPEMWRRDVSLLIFEGTRAIEKNQLPSAWDKFNKLIKVLPRDVENSRYLAASFLKRSRVEKMMKNYNAAVATLDSALHITYLYDINDVRVGLLAALTSVYRLNGQEKEAEETNSHYLVLKDSVMNSRYLLNFEQISFNAERNKLQQDLGRAESQRTFQFWMLLLCGVIIVTILFSLYLIKRKNSELKRRSEKLYFQLQQSLTDEDWRPANSTETEKVPVEDKSIEDNETETEPEVSTKYQGSKLDEEVKQQLAERIKEAARNGSFFNSDFTLSKLAEIVDSHPKYISQIINELFGCNFSTYVNQIRIREAMVRLSNNGDYAFYSIEGIAESVGFKSRSGFSFWFKKFSGLSPSEYRKLAQEDQKKNLTVQ